MKLINQIYLGSITISITYPGMFEGFVYVNSLLRINTKHLTQQILGMITKGPYIYYVSFCREKGVSKELNFLQLLLFFFTCFEPKMADVSDSTKGGFFFWKCDVFFQICKSPKKIFQITILNLKFRFPANNSKKQIQISTSG